MSDADHPEYRRLTALLTHGLAHAKHRPSLQRTTADPASKDGLTRARAKAILDRFFEDIRISPATTIRPLYQQSDGFRIDLVTKLEVSGGAGHELRLSGPEAVMRDVIADLEGDGVGFRRLGTGDPAREADQVG